MVNRSILQDADILQYEVSFAAEAFWKYLHAEKGEVVEGPPPFEIVESILLERIARIKDELSSDDMYLFFTGKGNYRHHIATIQPYKERDAERPFHYKNVKAYLTSILPSIEKPGWEADDLIGVSMTSHPGKYVCSSRDKDLRAIPGWHYGWELQNQPAFGPREIDELGFLELAPNRKKAIGGGGVFHCYQMLLGDTTDTIPGVPKYGVVNAVKALEGVESVEEAQNRVREIYRRVYEGEGDRRMLEVGRLLNMAREERNNYEEVLLWNPHWIDSKEWMNVETGEISNS